VFSTYVEPLYLQNCWTYQNEHGSIRSSSAPFFFLTYLLSNFCQTHFVERDMSFVLGNTNTPFPPCYFLMRGLVKVGVKDDLKLCL